MEGKEAEGDNCDEDFAGVDCAGGNGELWSWWANGTERLDCEAWGLWSRGL